MKVKVVDAMTANGLEKRINKFIRKNAEVEIINIQISTGFGHIVALIEYDE